MTKVDQLLALGVDHSSNPLQAVMEREQKQRQLSVGQRFELEQQKHRARVDQSPIVQWVQGGSEKAERGPLSSLLVKVS
ncbi:hypothetical protein [Comamonas sp. B-9]|uniref:hypothetical protein n=1 Tax=Comamonas sp. B-9 TaxID=1055192 RepID=UPI0011DE504E|nr:hypothetical protein [Comamonas sp. B-9]